MPLSHTLREQLYAELTERFTCNHETRELRRRTIKGGSTAYVRQCVKCGRVSNPIRAELAVQEAGGKQIPAYDETAEDRWNAEKTDAYKGVERKLKGGISDEYSRYLDSDAWRIVREKVIQRARGLCEGCLERRPTQVHHLTYQHLGEEFMWELVAVCNECHARIHPEEGDA